MKSRKKFITVAIILMIPIGLFAYKLIDGFVSQMRAMNFIKTYYTVENAADNLYTSVQNLIANPPLDENGSPIGDTNAQIKQIYLDAYGDYITESAYDKLSLNNTIAVVDSTVSQANVTTLCTKVDMDINKATKYIKNDYIFNAVVTVTNVEGKSFDVNIKGKVNLVKRGGWKIKKFTFDEAFSVQPPVPVDNPTPETPETTPTSN